MKQITLLVSIFVFALTQTLAAPTNGTTIPPLIPSRVKLPDHVPKFDPNATAPNPTPLSLHEENELDFRVQLANIATCRFVIKQQLWNETVCEILPDGHIELTYSGEKYDATFFIVTSKSKKSIYVSFRGTYSKKQLQADFEANLIPYSPVPGAKVYQGHFLAYMEVQGKMVGTVSRLLKKYPDYGVEVIGHSMGASNALFAALDLYQRIEKLNKSNIAIYSFGQPRSGDVNFAAYVNTVDMNYFRVTHAADQFANVPSTKLGYVHAGVEYWIKGNDSKDTLKCPARSYESPHCQMSVADGDNFADHILYYDTYIGDCK
ncbi:Alpha/Beta hydrolase protein [Gongronella butleri]|nr:Alpha/Beta hydrolase protein [Gongronella butleri]